MRIVRRLATVAAATALVAGVGLAAAPAAQATNSGTTTVTLKGGTTSFVTNPGIAKALLNAKILPYAVSPGKLGVASTHPLALRYSFPITSGSTVTLNSASQIVGADIAHTGGIRFVNLKNFKAVKVGNFDVRVGGQTGLFATQLQVGFAKPVATDLQVFTLTFTKGTTPIIQNGVAVVPGVELRLTEGAARALDQNLGTGSFFTGLAQSGTVIGVATVRAAL